MVNRMSLACSENVLNTRSIGRQQSHKNAQARKCRGQPHHTCRHTKHNTLREQLLYEPLPDAPGRRGSQSLARVPLPAPASSWPRSRTQSAESVPLRQKQRRPRSHPPVCASSNGTTVISEAHTSGIRNGNTGKRISASAAAPPVPAPESLHGRGGRKLAGQNYSTGRKEHLRDRRPG